MNPGLSAAIGKTLTLPHQAYAVVGDSCFCETYFLVQVTRSLTVSPQA
ncbi:MAG: hypothetical protein QNJ63_07175 [Calothrix sp. MO_192.B10]|nr:hypothetical protein [Calothrix sp. MO_192.B10]